MDRKFSKSFPVFLNLPCLTTALDDSQDHANNNTTKGDKTLTGPNAPYTSPYRVPYFHIKRCQKKNSVKSKNLVKFP